MRHWVGQTKSRSIEVGTILLVSSDDITDTQCIPSSVDQLCIHVSGEKRPATIVNASAELLAISLPKGPTLRLEPVAAGHPAHGERSAPGVPTSVWKVASVV